MRQTLLTALAICISADPEIKEYLSRTQVVEKPLKSLWKLQAAALLVKLVG